MQVSTTPFAAAVAFMWLVITTPAMAAPAASTWSLQPQPVEAHITGSNAARIANGALVAVRGADRQQVQPIADRCMQLVERTRGLQLKAATATEAHPAITFE